MDKPPRPLDRITFCEEEPLVIDEIVQGEGLHIERMNDQCYWMRVGERRFWITKDRGRCIITEEK